MEDGVWRTIRGRRIFIASGQSLGEAMAKSGKFNRSDIRETKVGLSQGDRFNDTNNKSLKKRQDAIKKMRNKDTRYSNSVYTKDRQDFKNQQHPHNMQYKKGETRVERNYNRYSENDQRELRHEELQKKLADYRNKKEKENDYQSRVYGSDVREADEQNKRVFGKNFKYAEEIEKENKILSKNDKELEKIKDYKAKKQSNNKVNTPIDKNAKFDSMEFEKKIPREMRWKETSSVNDGKDLYWVTQEPFTQDMLKQYAKEFKNQNRYEKAYVTTRDFSNYDYNDDIKNNTLAIVDRNGNISDSGYQKQMNENGWEYKNSNHLVETSQKMTRKQMAQALVDDQIKRGVVKAESRDRQVNARLTGKFKMSESELREYYNKYLKK